MYIEKKFPLGSMIKWTSKYVFIFLIMDIIPVILFKVFNWYWLAIPWQPIALVGMAVSFYLGFKNNSSYDRLWEARKIWGGIVNVSRTFTIMSRDFIVSENTKNIISNLELQKIHKSIIHRHVAWLKALTYQMRIPQPWEHNDKRELAFKKEDGVYHDDSSLTNLKPYITEIEYKYLMSKGNVAVHILSLQSKALLKLKKEGHIENFRHIELERMLGECYTLQGKSERIKNFPFPRQYATVNYIFVWLFLILLPFGMLNVFSRTGDSYMGWMAIPFTVVVSWVFILMEMVGDYSENPFEGLRGDVPISTMARGIEIDIRQMLDETDLPGPIKPVGEFGILY